MKPHKSIQGTSFLFVITNILVAFLGFVRSFAFMKFFDFKELGLITLISTGVMLIGFFQIGLINGGYRIIALQKEEDIVKTNNVLFSYFGTISLLLIVLYFIFYALSLLTLPIIVFITIYTGVIVLVQNWLTNSLIGSSNYSLLNFANFSSSIMGLLSIFLAYYYGLYGAAFTIFVQPAGFIVVVFLSQRNLLPKKFDLDLKHIKYILSFGFIPFLSGVFILGYMQLERWSITFFMNTESLGMLYLFFITSTLWILIPTAINNLLFPKAIIAFGNNKLLELRKIISNYFKLLFAYCFIGTLSIIFVFPYLVELIFPNHLPYLYLVILALPGLIFRIVVDPIGLFLNSVVKLKPIFWAEVYGIIVYIGCIFLLVFFGKFSLETIIISCNVYFGIRCLCLFYSYHRATRNFYLKKA